MNIETVLEDSLQQALEEVFRKIGYVSPEEIQVIFSHQNGLEPKNTYAIINIMDIDQQGFKDEGSYLDSDQEVIEFTAHYCMHTQISFVGANARAVGTDFKHNLINNRVCFETLMRSNFGITKRSNLRRVPQKRETQWVEALNMDLDFSFAINTKQAYDWIEFITVNGQTIRIRDAV